MRARLLFGCVLNSLLLTGPALAQDPQVRFPRNAANWVNSSPITEETLKGKAAVLYYYEES